MYELRFRRAAIDEDCSGVDTGRWIRCGVGGEKPLELGESGNSTVTPVEFGERGDAIIGAGIVCRLDGGEGEYSDDGSVSLRAGDAGGKANLSVERDHDGPSIEDLVGEAVGPSDRVLVARRSVDSGRLSESAPSAALERSSHLPRTALISRLPPTR